MLMTPHYGQFFCKPGDRSAIATSLNWDLVWIHEWCNHWFLILNPNKIKALVVSRSRTVNPPYGDKMSCPAFPFVLVTTFTFLAWSLTANSHLKTMCVVLSLMSLEQLVFWGWWNVSFWTPVFLHCYHAFVLLIFEYCSLVWGLLLNAIFSFSSTGCIWWSGFALIRVSCRVIDVMLLHCVCCTRLFQTWIIVCRRSFHLLLSDFDISVLRLQLIHYNFISRCKTSQYARCFQLTQTCVWNDPCTVFDTRMLDGFTGAVNRWLLPWVVFFSVSWCMCFWGCESNLWTILFFPQGRVLLTLIIIIIIMIMNNVD